MGLLRGVILAVLPARLRPAAEAESRLWMAECPACGVATSVWDHGGLRFMASGTPRRWMRCPQCGTRSWQRIAQREAPPGLPAAPGRPDAPGQPAPPASSSRTP